MYFHLTKRSHTLYLNSAKLLKQPGSCSPQSSGISMVLLSFKSLEMSFESSIPAS